MVADEEAGTWSLVEDVEELKRKLLARNEAFQNMDAELDKVQRESWQLKKELGYEREARRTLAEKLAEKMFYEKSQRWSEDLKQRDDHIRWLEAETLRQAEQIKRDRTDLEYQMRKRREALKVRDEALMAQKKAEEKAARVERDAAWRADEW